MGNHDLRQQSRTKNVDNDFSGLYNAGTPRYPGQTQQRFNLTKTRLKQFVIKQVASCWVLLFLMINGTSAYASAGPQVKITRAVMPNIKMEGQQVVLDVDYPISVSYETQCGSQRCNNQKIRLAVANEPSPLGECAGTGAPGGLPSSDLKESFAGFQVDYQLGDPSVHNFGEWGREFMLPNQSVNQRESTITLRKIKKKPTKPIHIWAEYNVNNRWCRDSKEVIVGTETVDRVQISGLDDRALSPEGKASLDTVCVYSSTGWALLLFDGSNTAPGKGKFQLRQTSTADHVIPYEIKINSSYGQSGVIGKFGYAQHGGGNRWKVSEEENCHDKGGRNMTFDIEATIGKDIPAGRYSETMTVTVAPQ